MAVVPVPVRETIVGEFPALLTNVAFPLAAPALCGLKVTETEVDFPAVTMNGADALTLKPGPVTLTDCTVTSAVPELESARFWDTLLPTFTFPNDREGAEGFKSPTGVDTPVPASATTVGELGRLLTTDADPLAVPVLCGENTTFAV